MSIRKLPGSSNYRVRRRDPTVGMIERTLRTSNRKEAQRRENVVHKLSKLGAMEALRMFKDGRLDINDLVDADRHGRLEQVAENLLMHRPLKSEIERWLPSSAPTKDSRRRYECSWRRFRRLTLELGILRANATVRDLSGIDFELLHRNWEASNADWNRTRAMISSFLTHYTGSVHSPLRLRVMGRYKQHPEPLGRIPDVDAATFWEIVRKASPHAQASYVAMAVLGCGPKEYLAIRPEDLDKKQMTVHIKGTKSVYRDRVVAVDERLWNWIDGAVPSNLQYRWLNEYWKRACKAAGVQGLRMYDLRHLSAQYAGDRGVTDRDLTIHLGHSNPSMSHRYSRRRTARGVAVAVADELVAGLGGQVKGQVAKRRA